MEQPLKVYCLRPEEDIQKQESGEHEHRNRRKLTFPFQIDPLCANIKDVSICCKQLFAWYGVVILTSCQTYICLHLLRNLIRMVVSKVELHQYFVVPNRDLSADKSGHTQTATENCVKGWDAM